MSFYQVNPVQTEKLYRLAVEHARLDQNDVIFDLYCGIGTIGIFASQYVKKVYGIEIVEEAIQNAKINAKLNHIENIEFMVGDTPKVLEELIRKRQVKADAVFVDPPRKGLDNVTIDHLLKMNPKKIAYISCNPSTLVRDLQKLEERYHIDTIIPVDMFPFTSHVECVAVLYLKDSIQ